MRKIHSEDIDSITGHTMRVVELSGKDHPGNTPATDYTSFFMEEEHNGALLKFERYDTLEAVVQRVLGILKLAQLPVPSRKGVNL